MSENKSKEHKRSSLLFDNIKKGHAGEIIAKIDYKNNGYTIIPTGIGSDFIAVKFVNDNKQHHEFVEVKTGKSKASKRQKITMRRLKREGKNYTIYRITDAFLQNYLDSNADVNEVDSK